MIVTPNGVDGSTFHPDARQDKYDLPQKYILFLGTLEPRKNLNGLLRAWNELQNDYPDVWLVVAGTRGNVFKPVNLRTEVERVRFLGYVEDEDLPGLHAGAILFVLPSFDEGFGLPALEAMACGTPVIVANGGVLCEVIGDAGMIFDLSKSGDLSNAMSECLSDKSLCVSFKEKGLTRAKSFSWQTSADVIWKTLMKSEPRLAFILDALPSLGGAEKVLFTALEIYPQADVFTLIYNKKVFNGTPLAKRNIRTSYLNAIPFAQRHHRLFLPFMPRAIESFDLREYDGIVSFNYAVAHGVRNPNKIRHIAYTYTPMRYAWTNVNLDGTHTRQNLIVDQLMNAFRKWDVIAASHIHEFAAISQAVARRIKSAWGRAGTSYLSARRA